MDSKEKKTFDYENNFYLTCGTSRIAKFIAHYELSKSISLLTGDIVECGVFKGASFMRLAMLRDLFSPGKMIIGFDTFDKFPRENGDGVQEFIDKSGDMSISRHSLEFDLRQKNIVNYELIKGDINGSVPDYVSLHPELKISLLNLDCDNYKPSLTVLEHLYPKIVRGGIIMLDNYGVFKGETRAVDEYFKGSEIIRRLPFSRSPSYIIKGVR